LWSYEREGWARRFFENWRASLKWQRLKPYEKFAAMILLPDREPATAQAWLAGQPQITIVARDRGGSYTLAAAKALPHAAQVADRWHLMENASHAFLDAVRKSMRHVRTAIGAATVNPDLLTSAERIQYEGYLRREQTNAAILKQAEAGASIKQVVRLTGHSRGLVRSSDPMCSGFARVRSNITCHGSTHNGPPGFPTAPSCGDVLPYLASGARFGSLRNGRHAAGAPKSSRQRDCTAFRPPERSPGS
jgi:hypothetical protein